jgi:hypothetical protein
MVDVGGLEPPAACLQSKRKFNLSRCFSCAYKFSRRFWAAPKPAKLRVAGSRDVRTRLQKSAAFILCEPEDRPTTRNLTAGFAT